MTDAEAEIRAVLDAFVAAYDRGDVESILACYAEDLVKLRSGAPAETKAETGRRLAELFASYTGALTARIDEVLVSGDMAFSSGSVRIALTPRAGGEAKTLERRTVELWRLSNGRWLVCRTMDNAA
jgi:ketosteroid isomerase-like protein